MMSQAQARRDVMPALTDDRKYRLSQCEEVIGRGLETFYEVGKALLTVRDEGLYKEAGFKTFEDYCRERWELVRQRAYQLMGVAKVVSNLSKNFDTLPDKESHAAQLEPLDTDAQKAVWQITLKTAPVGDDGKPKVTAAHIKSVTEVLTEVVRTGGLDDGNGEVKPLGMLVDAAVTEETYERVMRQKEYIRQDKKEKREAKERENARRAELLNKEYPLVTDRYRLVEGDFVHIADRTHDIAPKSVDAIICDPPYGHGVIGLCEELAKRARQWLKPGGSLVVMVGQYKLPGILYRMSKWIDYRWTLAYLTPGGQSPQIWPSKVNTFWKPVLWFTNGEYSGEWIGDVAKSATNDNDKRFHHWGQSESGMADLVERFTRPGDVILDPFLGGGTTGVVALNLNRRFIGIDMSGEAIKTASARLADVQG